jgi:hypothetical protein
VTTWLLTDLNKLMALEPADLSACHDRAVKEQAVKEQAISPDAELATALEVVKAVLVRRAGR